MVQNVSMSSHLALSTYLSNLIHAFSNHKKIEIIALVSKGYVEKGLIENVEILEANTNLYSFTGNIRFFVWVVYTLANLDRKKHIDVIHCLYPSSSTLAGLLYRFFFGNTTKVVYDIRSPWIDMTIKRVKMNKNIVGLFRCLALILEKKIVKSVDGVVFITEGLMEEYDSTGLLGDNQLTISPSGVDTDHFTTRSPGKLKTDMNIGVRKHILGYVGGVAKTRKLDFVIKGFVRLSTMMDDWCLVIIGDGDDLENLKLIVDSDSIHNVHFLGRIPYSEIQNLISDFDVGVCHLPDTPIFNTSFPMKVLEYLACGVPTVLSNISAHRNIAEKLDGIEIYNFSIDNFANAVIKVNNESGIDINQVIEFSWPNITRKLLTFYAKLTS